MMIVFARISLFECFDYYFSYIMNNMYIEFLMIKKSEIYYFINIFLILSKHFNWIGFSV